MNQTDLNRIAHTLHTAATLLETHGTTTLQLLQQWSARGYPNRGDDPTVTNSTISDPTAGAAFHPDHHHQQLTALNAHIRQAHGAAADINNIITRTTHQEKPKGRENTVSTCANPWCEDIATKAGRCDPCYTYRRRHDRDAPRTIIDTRQANR